MLIAVLSDSHDRTDHLEYAINQAKERGITTAFHLGDFCSPFVLEQLGQSGLTWYVVWGNNDGDKLRGTSMAAGQVDIVPDDYRELDLEGRKLFLTHYPQIGRIAALSAQYDAVFFGHNHQASQEIISQEGSSKKTLLANPGEIYGMRTGKPSFAIYNTEDNSFEHVWFARL